MIEAMKRVNATATIKWLAEEILMSVFWVTLLHDALTGHLLCHRTSPPQTLEPS